MVTVPDFLEGTVVVEVASGVAGPLAARTLADVGATCLKIEPKTGDVSRSWGPFFDCVPDENKSVAFAAYNHGKSSIVLDLQTNDGRASFDDLLDRADILIVDECTVDADNILAKHPSLVIVCVTPFGCTGPYAGRPATDIVAYAVGGAMSATGLPHREPCWLAGSLVQTQAGSVAACAAVAGLLAAEQSGRGQIIDVSWVEAELSSMDRSAFFAMTYSYTRVNASRQMRPPFPLPNGVMPCADGCVIVSTYGWHISNMLDTIGSERLDALLRDSPGNLWRPESEAIVREEVLSWLSQRSRIDAARAAQSNGWCVTPVNDLLELESDPWLRSASALERAEIIKDRQILIPGPAYRAEGGPRFRGPAPGLGESGHLPATRPRSARKRPGEILNPNLAQPLGGVRILDLCVVLSGPFATLMLSDLGAEVIRIESCQHYPDTSKGPRRLSDKAFQYGDNMGRGYLESFPGPRPWRRRASSNLICRNKLSMTVDLTRPSGREIFLRLCERSDCIMENNQPIMMKKLGLEWPALRERNPRLVFIRMPPLDSQGEGAMLKGVGSNFEGMAGLMSFRGYADLPIEAVQPSYRMDATTGPTAAQAAMLAIRRARATGVGCEIVLSQTVNLLHHAAEQLLEAQVTGVTPLRRGNGHPRMAPHGCYEAMGDDEWIVLACRDENDWTRLQAAMGNPEWSKDSHFETLSERLENLHALDERINQWSKDLPAGYLESLLARFGIPSAQVRREAEKFADPHFRARQFFRTLEDSEAGVREYPGHLWRTSGGLMRWDRAAPTLGQDNDYVYREVLGCSDEEIADLTEAGHIGDRYFFEVSGL